MEKFSKILAALALVVSVGLMGVFIITTLNQDKAAAQSVTKPERLNTYYSVFELEGSEALTERIHNGLSEADCRVEELDTDQFDRAVNDYHVIAGSAHAREKQKAINRVKATRFHSTFKRALTDGCREKFNIRTTIKG